jgi:outer membrane biosynthesis protein TonB
MFLCGTAFAQTVADTEAKLTSAINFVMPQQAIGAELDGDILVRVKVEASGKASSASIASGLMWPCGKSPTKEIDVLSEAISDNVRGATFSPAIKKGKPVESEIGLRFTIKNPRTAPARVNDPDTGKPFAALIQGGVLNGKATFLAKPTYPVEARAQRIDGSISVVVLIDETGNVTRVGYNSGKVMFLPGVIPAVCSSKFSPTTLKGRPIKVSGTVTYNFVS